MRNAHVLADDASPVWRQVVRQTGLEVDTGPGMSVEIDTIAPLDSDA